jgi:hypothetical protein
MTTLHAGGKFDEQLLQGLRRASRRRESAWSTRSPRSSPRDPPRREGMASRYLPRHSGGADLEVGTTRRGGHDHHASAPTPEIFTVDRVPASTSSRHLRELAFLNSGHPIQIQDDEIQKAHDFLLRRRHREFTRVPQSQQGHPAPGSHLPHRRQRARRSDRGRDAVARRLHRERLLAFANNINNGRGRDPPDRVSGPPSRARSTPTCPGAEPAQEQPRKLLRRGRPRGPDGGDRGQASGSREFQARRRQAGLFSDVKGSSNGRQRAARDLLRGAPRRGRGDRLQGASMPRGRARPRARRAI